MTKEFRVYGALLLVQILFGLNYAISKILVHSFPPLVWAVFRLWIATALMMLWARLSRVKFPAVTREEKWQFFSQCALFSLFGIVINQSAFLIGLKYTNAVNASILNTLTPILTLLIAIFLGREKWTVPRGIGFTLAFVGVLVVRKVEEFQLSDQTWFGDSLMLVNCLSFSLYLVMSKGFWQKYGSVWATAFLFFWGSVGVTVLSVSSWKDFVWPVMTGTLVASGIFAILGSTLLTYLLGNFALARINPSRVALFINLQPIVAGLLAWSWFGEPITPRAIFAYVLIFVGMLLVLKPANHLPIPAGVE